MSTPAPLAVSVVAPTYNNASTLPAVLADIEREAPGLPVIVVDDGCSDGTGEILARWSAGGTGELRVVVTHGRNRGKAAALVSGFGAAAERGLTHAVTIDTDGQLDADQIPDLLEAARAAPDALVVGCRDASRADYPFRSRFGRTLSNLAIRVESGVRVGDSQCGYRVYPLSLLDEVACGAGRFGFEAEIITRAGWAGRPVLNVPVRCRYFEADRRVSHFRPGRDSLAGVLLHGRLMAMAPLRRWRAWRRRRGAGR